MEQYPEMIYGQCLHRMIHWIVALRRDHPDKRILISKYDFSDAYRRVTHSASAAIQTILTVGSVAYIMLRLAFGGSPNPPAWCAFSEMITDLANEIALDDEWDPTVDYSTDAPPPSEPILLDESNPPKGGQKAVTPKFLRAVYANGHKRRANRLLHQHASDLIIAVFFFTCRACEYVVTPTLGVTRCLTLRNITFRDDNGTEVPQHHPSLERRATRVTVCFEDQKNRDKLDRHTQRSTNDRILCPVRRLASLVNRILRYVPDASGATSLCTIVDDALQIILIDSAFTLSYLRSTCFDYGGALSFGFHPLDIGNKSIRSGAAMALFMANTLPARIMLMGRWKSLSFLDYLGPQVLEWTHYMSTDMIRLEHFFDLNSKSSRPPSLADNGRPIVIPSFDVNYDRILNK